MAGMAIKQLGDGRADLQSLVRRADMERAAVMLGTLLVQIAVLHQLFYVVRHVGAQIVAALGQFPHRQFLGANVEQDQGLDVVHIADGQTIKLRLHQFQALAVQALDQLDGV